MRLFRLSRRGSGSILGPLETEVMEAVWSQDEPVSVGRVQELLGRRRKAPAYSTVKAVLSNLTEKGHLRKRTGGRSNTFAPVLSREAFREEVVSQVLGSLVRDYRNPFLAHLVDELASEPGTLDDLERLIADKRREIERG